MILQIYCRYHTVTDDIIESLVISQSHCQYHTVTDDITESLVISQSHCQYHTITDDITESLVISGRRTDNITESLVISHRITGDYITQSLTILHSHWRYNTESLVIYSDSLEDSAMCVLEPGHVNFRVNYLLKKCVTSAIISEAQARDEFLQTESTSCAYLPLSVPENIDQEPIRSLCCLRSL